MIWVLVAVAAVVLALGAGIPVFAGRGRAGDDEEIVARARYHQLGHYVENPVATNDPEAAALLRQGRERWDSAGATLATARAAAEFELVARICGQGLA
ncbi:hypothetical protein [Amycolatopsis sp.]|uniref:hypothetical protein n=1 Tax=Amycolatopsis sp. TaxID=37632 RepID=UPI002BE8AFDE|nr:hypothetical protein [Amycolatopsis sp.]HVV13152.1 hypothetical protein [Amycolatopsis sp.]